MRLPTPGAFSPRQQEVSEAIARRRGGIGGPFSIWLRSPDLCEKVEALAAYCSSDACALPPRLRELVLLIAARHWGAQHPWNAHLDKAVAVGLAPAALGRLAAGQEPDFPGQDERVVYQFATQLLGGHFVSDEAFSAALDLLGERGLVDLIGALGNFSMQALLLNACQADLQQDHEPPFPDVAGFGYR